MRSSFSLTMFWIYGRKEHTGSSMAEVGQGAGRCTYQARDRPHVDQGEEQADELTDNVTEGYRRKRKGTQREQDATTTTIDA